MRYCLEMSLRICLVLCSVASKTSCSVASRAIPQGRTVFTTFHKTGRYNGLRNNQRCYQGFLALFLSIFARAPGTIRSLFVYRVRWVPTGVIHMGPSLARHDGPLFPLGPTDLGVQWFELCVGSNGPRNMNLSKGPYIMNLYRR